MLYNILFKEPLRLLFTYICKVIKALQSIVRKGNRED